MNEVLLIHTIQSKRDVIRARQRARQVAGLLGYGTREQAEIAAATFVLALDGLHRSREIHLRFSVGDETLSVIAETPSGDSCSQLRLQRSLPVSRKFSAEDCRFITGQLAQFTPRDLFTEVEKQNLELIQVLVELRGFESSLPQMAKKDANVA